MTDQKYQISVLMPALNEEKNISAALTETLKAFDHLGINGQIVAINDGSTDRTGEIIAEFERKHQNITHITHDRPHGIGASFWDGVDKAEGDIVVMLPGDNENDPPEIFRYCKLLEHVDIVIPFIFNKQARSLFRNGLSFLYRFIINTSFLVYFNYTNGTILYRKSILGDIKYRSTGFFFQTDILIRLVKDGYLFAEVPYRLGMRKTGVSKAVSFPSFLQVAKGYIRLVRDQYFTKHHEPHYTGDSQTLKRRQEK